MFKPHAPLVSQRLGRSPDHWPIAEQFQKLQRLSPRGDAALAADLAAALQLAPRQAPGCEISLGPRVLRERLDAAPVAQGSKPLAPPLVGSLRWKLTHFVLATQALSDEQWNLTLLRDCPRPNALELLGHFLDVLGGREA